MVAFLFRPADPWFGKIVGEAETTEMEQSIKPDCVVAPWPSRAQRENQRKWPTRSSNSLSGEKGYPNEPFHLR